MDKLPNCTKFSIDKSTVSSFYKEDKFIPCLTKQLLNMFKLWWSYMELLLYQNKVISAIVRRGDLLGKPANMKVENNGAIVYV